MALRHDPTPKINPGPTGHKRKRTRNSSTDSSILEAVPQPRNHSATKHNTKPDAVGDHNRGTTAHKKQRISSKAPEASSYSSVAGIPRKETFERRARHKTREDRYDPNKKNKQKKGGEDDKRQKKKKETKSERRKANKRAGEDLMRNFSSKSIGQERLTVSNKFPCNIKKSLTFSQIRPNSGLGLFNNGRTSSPAKRRGCEGFHSTPFALH